MWPNLPESTFSQYFWGFSPKISFLWKMPEKPGKSSFAQFGAHFGLFSGICLILTGFNSSSSIKITTFDLRSRKIKGDVGSRPILGPFSPIRTYFFILLLWRCRRWYRNTYALFFYPFLLLWRCLGQASNWPPTGLHNLRKPPIRLRRHSKGLQ